VAVARPAVVVAVEAAGVGSTCKNIGAYQMQLDDVQGSILSKAKVMMTIFDGRTVY